MTKCIVGIAEPGTNMNRQQLRESWRRDRMGYTFQQFCKEFKIIKQEPIVAYKDKTRVGYRRRNGLI
jgi:hypothetical protein